MKITKRILAVFVAVILLTTAFVFTTNATDGNPDVGGDVVTPDPEPVVPEPTSAPVTPDPVVPEPTNAPVTPEPTNAPDIDTDYDDGSSDGYIEDNTTNGTSEFYTPDSNGSYGNSEESAGNVTGNTALYNSDINDKNLEESKWTNITLDTSNDSSDVQDFTAIKKNNTPKTNTLGKKYLIIGIILLGLSLSGILYYCVATSKYKKKLNRLKAREQRSREKHSHSDDLSDRSEYPTQEQYNRRYQKNRYSDTAYHSRTSSKSDTAEIPVKKYKARH